MLDSWDTVYSLSICVVFTAACVGALTDAMVVSDAFDTLRLTCESLPLTRVDISLVSLHNVVYRRAMGTAIRSRRNMLALVFWFGVRAGDSSTWFEARQRIAGVRSGFISRGGKLP